MLSAEPERLTSALWLAAHDGVGGRPVIEGRPLGVGLGCALLAELMYEGYLQLLDGELFRTPAPLPMDPALQPVLAGMAEEEQRWHLARARAAVPAPRHDHDGRATTSVDRSWPAAGSDGVGQQWLGARHDERQPRPMEQTRHRRPGHRLDEWLPFLANGRAESFVLERLIREGLAMQVQQRRMFGFGAVETTYVPCDSVAAATPANLISIAVVNRQPLDHLQLFLAGLLLATGLHHHGFQILGPSDRAYLNDQFKDGLDGPSKELLLAAEHAVAAVAAMR